MNDVTIDFLRYLFSDAQGWLELTYIHPARDKGHNIASDFYELGHSTVDWDRAERMNADGWGVYYGCTTARRRPPQGRRRREADVLTLPCVWCEIDVKDGYFADVDAILNSLYDFDYPPSALIASGGGVHSIWMIDPITVTRDNRPAIKEILRGLAVYLHADTSATDTARVLRLPDTINTKPERNGARCEIIDLLPGRFTLNDFAWLHAYASPVQRPIERDVPRHRPDDLQPYIVQYLDTPTPSGQRNRTLYNVAYYMHSEGYTQQDAEAVLVSKALSDGLGERETLRTIQSAYDAPPGTPGYVSRRGGLRMRAGDALKRLRGE